MNKKKEFNRISKDIKSVKIQGARNIAKAGLKAYNLIPTSHSKKKLLSLRPTEPMLEKVLKLTSTLKDKIVKVINAIKGKVDIKLGTKNIILNLVKEYIDNKVNCIWTIGSGSMRQNTIQLEFPQKVDTIFTINPLFTHLGPFGITKNFFWQLTSNM